MNALLLEAIRLSGGGVKATGDVRLKLSKLKARLLGKKPAPAMLDANNVAGLRDAEALHNKGVRLATVNSSRAAPHIRELNNNRVYKAMTNPTKRDMRISTGDESSIGSGMAVTRKQRVTQDPATGSIGFVDSTNKNNPVAKQLTGSAARARRESEYVQIAMKQLLESL